MSPFVILQSIVERVQPSLHAVRKRRFERAFAEAAVGEQSTVGGTEPSYASSPRDLISTPNEFAHSDLRRCSPPVGGPEHDDIDVSKRPRIGVTAAEALDPISQSAVQPPSPVGVASLVLLPDLDADGMKPADQASSEETAKPTVDPTVQRDALLRVPVSSLGKDGTSPRVKQDDEACSEETAKPTVDPTALRDALLRVPVSSLEKDWTSPRVKQDDEAVSQGIEELSAHGAVQSDTNPAEAMEDPVVTEISSNTELNVSVQPTLEHEQEHVEKIKQVPTPQRDSEYGWSILGMERPAKPPALGAKEWLEDEHLSYTIWTFIGRRSPAHVWLATPTQVALLRAGRESKDRELARDGSLSSMWDSPNIRLLLLPINSDPRAGRCSNGGVHWSLLIVRRRADGQVDAIVRDSLACVPVQTANTAQAILRRLAQSRYWEGAPRRAALIAERLQHDNYQCGVYCLLAMHKAVEAELGNHVKVDKRMAQRLRCLLSNQNEAFRQSTALAEETAASCM